MNAQHVSDEPESVFAAMGRQIALTPIIDPRPATLRRRLASHPRLTAGGAGALIAAAVAAVVIFTTGALTTAPPAFAVAVSGNNITITLHQFAALKSLNARLAAENLPIRAVPVVPGCSATARIVGANGTVTRTIKAGYVSGPATLRISLTHRPPPGDTLVIGAAGDHSLLFPHEIKGPAPGCIGAGPTLPRPKRAQP